MPVYEYRCDVCGVAWCDARPVEERNDPDPCPRQPCPGQSKLQISTGTTFVLKGTGWARDGYK
jgi:putative FmdB family regulatory protein